MIALVSWLLNQIYSSFFSECLTRAALLLEPIQEFILFLTRELLLD